MTASNKLGIMGNNVIVPYTAATRQSKWLNFDQSSGAYSVSGTNWSTVKAYFMFYADSSGLWRARFNIRGTLSVGASSVVLTVNSVTFDGNSGNFQAASAVTDAAGEAGRAYVSAGASTITIDTPSFTSGGWSVSGDVALASNPTTYTTAANMEGVTSVYVYIAPASATAAGLLNYYDAGTFSATFNLGMYTGSSGNTVTISYVSIGKMVSLHFPAMRVTANATSPSTDAAAGTLPASLRPSSYQFNPMASIYDNNQEQAGYLFVGSDGYLAVYKYNKANFTSGTTNCGFGNGCVTYMLP